MLVRSAVPRYWFCAAIGDVVVRIFGRDGDRTHRAGHIGVGEGCRHDEVIRGCRTDRDPVGRICLQCAAANADGNWPSRRGDQIRKLGHAVDGINRGRTREHTRTAGQPRGHLAFIRSVDVAVGVFGIDDGGKRDASDHSARRLADDLELRCRAGSTMMPVSEPVMAAFTVSVTMIDCVAAVSSVAEKVCTPSSPAAPA